MGSSKFLWIFPPLLSLVANEGQLITAGRLVSSSSSLESTFIILRAILRELLMVFDIRLSFLFKRVYNLVFGQFKSIFVFKRRTRRYGTNIIYDSSIRYNETCRHNCSLAVLIVGNLKYMDSN